MDSPLNPMIIKTKSDTLFSQINSRLIFEVIFNSYFIIKYYVKYRYNYLNNKLLETIKLSAIELILAFLIEGEVPSYVIFEAIIGLLFFKSIELWPDLQLIDYFDSQNLSDRYLDELYSSLAVSCQLSFPFDKIIFG